MNNKIKYQDWPQIVKITTALSNRELFIKSPTFPFVVGYFCLIGGVFGLAYAFYKEFPITLENYIPKISYILIGLASIISGNSIKWIVSNSSWKERFENKSSIANKIIYILISMVLSAGLVGIIIL